MWRFILGISVIILASYWAVRPLFSPGFFPMHDDTQVGRVVAMGAAIRNGQFPVRWVSDLGYGYGYPIFNFYGPLPYYAGGALYALGMSGLSATKAMFVLGMVLAAISMYFSVVPFLGQEGAIAAGILYLYAPYHAVQVYVRGAVGEFWALIFLPLIFWSILSSFSGVEKQKKAILVGSLGLAGVIVSHTILGYIVIVLSVLSLVAFWAVRIFQKRVERSLLRTHVLTLLAGLGITAFFWLPAIAEMRYTTVAAQIGSSARYTDHFVCLSQLWNSPWGFGGSVPGCSDGLSFRLGKLQILGAGVALLLWFIGKKLRVPQFIWLAFGMTMLALFFMLPVSSFAWTVLPGFAFIQYPWRFLVFAIFGLSLLSASLVVIPKNSLFRILIMCILAVGTIIYSAKLFRPQYLYARDPKAFESREELRFRVSKISDEYLPAAIERPKSVSDVPSEAIVPTQSFRVETEIDRETYAKFILMSTSDQIITINRAYFPGWKYWVNGKETEAKLVRGLPTVPVPQGYSVVEMRLVNTPVRSLANAVSIVTILFLIYAYGKKTNA